jgi:uncharacterized protein
MAAKEIALGNEILRGVVGSTAHGTAVDGQDDRDEMAVFIETPENVCGLTPCDHYIQRDQPEGVRSQPGDLDLTMYSLRKFCRLAEQGNPSVVILLWLPRHVTKTELGAGLVKLREAFISRDSGNRFLGYLVAQKMKMKGERNQTVNRPELIEKYGFDTKFAMHALRLAFEGIEMLTCRSITLPVAEPNLSILRGVRTGKYTLEQTLLMIDNAEAQLRELLKDCDWKTDRRRIDAFMVKAHQQHWQARFSSTVERRAVDAEMEVRSLRSGPLAAVK